MVFILVYTIAVLFAEFVLTALTILVFENAQTICNNVVYFVKYLACKLISRKCIWIIIPVVIFISLALFPPFLCPTLLSNEEGKSHIFISYWGCLATLAATFVALYKEEFWEWVNRPKLKIEFENRPPMYSFLPITTNKKGCILNILGNFMNRNKQYDGLCCRLRIVNEGLGNAKNVFLRIQSADPNSNFAPMNLKWMNLDVRENKTNKIDSSYMPVICPHIHYYCNLGEMAFKDNENTFDLYTEVKANDKCWQLKKGIHKFNLILSADKVKPICYELVIKNNRFYRNENEMMKKGLVIEPPTKKLSQDVYGKNFPDK